MFDLNEIIQDLYGLSDKIERMLADMEIAEGPEDTPDTTYCEIPGED